MHPRPASVSAAIRPHPFRPATRTAALLAGLTVLELASWLYGGGMSATLWHAEAGEEGASARAMGVL